MHMKHHARARALKTSVLSLTLGALVILVCSTIQEISASPPWLSSWRTRPSCDCGPRVGSEHVESTEWEGTWHWLRSPDQEKRVVVSLYNRYCIRCHGVDGRGVWDIPDVPDFTNARWQASRSDGQLVRLTLEGRGAVMPPFRGTLSLDEAWAVARYLRTLVPGTEVARPDFSPAKQPGSKSPAVPPASK